MQQAWPEQSHTSYQESKQMLSDIFRTMACDQITYFLMACSTCIGPAPVHDSTVRNNGSWSLSLLLHNVSAPTDPAPVPGPSPMQCVYTTMGNYCCAKRRLFRERSSHLKLLT